MTLDAARELFRQAGEDADAGRFAVALGKYQRVAKVKETAQVRFNIGRCEEQLGQIGSALADYEAAEAEAKKESAQEVGGLSHDRANALRPRVPHLTLVPPSPIPPNFVVKLDGAVVSADSFGTPLPVDPGRHRIEATSGGGEPFVREVEIAEKEALRAPLSLEASSTGGQAGVTHETNVPPPAPDTSGGISQRTWGEIAVGGGVALGVGSLIFALVHNGKASDVKSECPNGQCPHSVYDQASSDKSSASTMAGLSWGFGIAGVVAAGAGVALFLTAPKDSTQPAVAIAPGAAGAPAGASLVGRF